MAEEVGATVTGSTQVFDATTNGLVPAVGTVTGTKVLHDDGTWAVPGGGISALTGDVTASGSGSVAATIAAGVVTNAKLAAVATNTFKGRVTAGTGDPEDLTGTQATTLLDVFTSGLKGLVPASGGGTTNFLRADGTFAAPSAGANTTLSNLTSPTAINQDLNLDAGKNILLKNNTFINAYKADGTTIVPLVRLDTTDVMAIGTGSGQTVRMNAGIFAPTSNGNDLGTSALAWDIFINNVLSDIKISGTRVIQSLDAASSAPLTITTGAGTAGSSASMTVKTGDATTTAGNVVLQAGAVAGTRANVNVLASTLDCTGVNLFKLTIPQTITAGGTTGNQTINRISGTVNFAAAATTLTVTNSLVTANSLIFCEVRTNDATAMIKNVVPAAGSFVITLSAAATAETSVGFFITN